MPILGAHMSIAGGHWKAAVAARAADCDAVQIFTKNNNRWAAKPITEEDAQKFKDKMAEENITHSLSHASYLINLASPKDELRQKSIDAMVIELQRANTLGVPHVVFHPGSFTTSSEAEGVDAIVQSLDEIHSQTSKLTTIPLLENTAGQGSNLGWKFEHLKSIMDGVKDSKRIGVCIDTCHTFAAGYPLAPEKQYADTMNELDSVVGIQNVKAFHLNDSKKPFGSRKDRHEHIGEGEMGLKPFRLLLNDDRFAAVPMYLETEKGEREGEDFDVMNMKVLRGLIV